MFVWLVLFFSLAVVVRARQTRANGPREESAATGSLQIGLQTDTEQGFLARSRRNVVIAGAIIILQAALISALLIERSRKRRANTKLAESEERFAKAFKANPQPMLLTTLNEGRFVDVNEAFLTMSGFTREEIIGRTCLETGFFASEGHRHATIEPLLQTGSARNVELACPTKSGATRLLLCAGELIDLGGEKCIVVASTDITERKESEQQLAELTARLLRTQDEERRRIARELHDVTAQSIGLIMLNLAQVQSAASSLDGRSKERLAESLAFGEQALKDIRTLSYVLHPPLLDHAGLITALKWYVKGFNDRSDVKVQFSENGNDGQRMPPEVEYALFRVVQECLTNIRRHTNSETAEIKLTRTDGEVSLSVRDHGKGNKLQIARNGDGAEFVGVGIPGMRHRLKELGGDLLVDSSLDGTTVTATVPVRWEVYDSDSVS
ncbi:MAG TPA: PAS domain S-box protein [Pyrinomonadaceae bacterium]|nr:PAS domain S-box protein [Pyrinomonadaceae bacterium]